LAFLLNMIRRLGADVVLGDPSPYVDGDILIDCRGGDAINDLVTLSRVRRERAVVQMSEIKLQRLVRLLHPPHALYVVPWSIGSYMIRAGVT
jgi:glycine oxidase